MLNSKSLKKVKYRHVEKINTTVLADLGGHVIDLRGSWDSIAPFANHAVHFVGRFLFCSILPQIAPLANESQHLRTFDRKLAKTWKNQQEGQNGVTEHHRPDATAELGIQCTHVGNMDSMWGFGHGGHLHRHQNRVN